MSETPDTYIERQPEDAGPQEEDACPICRRVFCQCPEDTCSRCGKEFDVHGHCRCLDNLPNFSPEQQRIIDNIQQESEPQ